MRSSVPRSAALVSIALVLAIETDPLSADVVINEFVAATSNRLVRIDDAGAPHLGAGPDWHAPEFDDSGWLAGGVPLGYGTGGLATTLKTPPEAPLTSVYARTRFDAPPDILAGSVPVVLDVNYDDGFVAYLNGREVARRNLGGPGGFVYHDQPAFNNHPSTGIETINLGPAVTLLRESGNVLAIQTHASAISAGSLRMDAGLRSGAGGGIDLVGQGADWRILPGLAEPSGGIPGSASALPRSQAPDPYPPGWALPDFDDSEWAGGLLPAGYGVSSVFPVATDLSAQLRNRGVSACFRIPFRLEAGEPAAIASLRLDLTYDDGFVAFVNGHELARRSLGASGTPVGHDEPASSDNGASVGLMRSTIAIPPGVLREGVNVIAVQTHNASPQSADFYLELAAESADLGRVLVPKSATARYVAFETEPTDGEAEDGSADPDFVDWIELANTGAAPVNLQGWSLTDDPDNPTKWTFPATIVPPGGFLVVLASGRDIADPDEDGGRLHTNFRLSAKGEYLGLFDASGRAASELAPGFPPQSPFHSYGRSSDGVYRHFAQATPGGPNSGPEFDRLLPPPAADHESGFYAADVPLRLTTDVPGAVVRYTTDGTEPTATNGLVFDGGILATGGESIGQPGSILHEVWTGVPGTRVTDIPTGSQPDLVSTTTRISLPPDWTDNFGDRMRGVLIAPASGVYTFWISSNDEGELWLSTTAKSQDKRRIAHCPSGVAYGAIDTFASQRSAAIQLEAGNRYYLEVLRKEGSGSDHLIVSWEGPGFSRRTLSDSALAPVVPPPPSGQARHVVVKARTFLPGAIPSETVTRTFLIGHSERMRSAPALLVSGDPERALYRPNGATSIVGGTWANDTWSPTNPAADYNFALMNGRAFERPIVLEFLESDGTLGFRTGAGIRIAGSPHARPRYRLTNLETSTWTGSWTEKPSFGLYFRDEYGVARLEHPLFGPDGVTEFDNLRLRAGKNDSVNPFIRDEFLRRLSAATGQVASRGIFCNLFVNGHHKGYYNLVERLREPFFQEHFRTSAEWDIWHIREIVEGDSTHYSATMDLLRSRTMTVDANYAEAEARVDMASYIDYILVNAWGATGDWPHNNYNIARERTPDGRWKFFVWDAEGCCGGFGHDVNWNTFASDLLNGSLGGDPHMTRAVYKACRANPEFRLHFADRIHRHFFNGGGLTQEAIRDVFVRTRDEMNPIMLAVRGTTVDEGFFNAWWPNRRQILFNHFRSENLWPATQPPVLSRHGGEIAPGTAISISNPNPTGTIHFTTDGTDPRARGGAVSGRAYSSPLTLNQSAVVKARVRSGSGEWSPLTEALFTTPQPPTLAISEILYHPAGSASEFIEIVNHGDHPVDLAGLEFTEGIAFTFTGGVLSPGATLVLVKDATSFAADHPGVPIAGTFTGSLDNAGERVTVAEPGGRIVFSVRFDDAPPWPPGPDTDGRSLVLVGDPGALDPDDPSSWRDDGIAGGTPGRILPDSYRDWAAHHFPGFGSDADGARPTDDFDGDGAANLAEYALSSDPRAPDAPSWMVDRRSDGPGDILVVEFRRRVAAADVEIALEGSDDLSAWAPVAGGTEETRFVGDGTLVVSRRMPLPASHARAFRLRVSLRP